MSPLHPHSFVNRSFPRHSRKAIPTHQECCCKTHDGRLWIKSSWWVTPASKNTPASQPSRCENSTKFVHARETILSRALSTRRAWYPCPKPPVEQVLSPQCGFLESGMCAPVDYRPESRRPQRRKIAKAASSCVFYEVFSSGGPCFIKQIDQHHPRVRFLVK